MIGLVAAAYRAGRADAAAGRRRLTAKERNDGHGLHRFYNMGFRDWRPKDTPPRSLPRPRE